MRLQVPTPTPAGNGATAADPRGLAARLDQGLERLALSLAEDTRQRLLRYVALLDRWNRTYNLTAIRDPERMLHVCRIAHPDERRRDSGRAAHQLDGALGVAAKAGQMFGDEPRQAAQGISTMNSSSWFRTASLVVSR